MGTWSACGELASRARLSASFPVSSSRRIFSDFEFSMSIQVTCPGCLTRFQVNDKFAGKKGPCPKCKAEIMIPDKSDEVVIHAPEHSGPKDSQGRSVLKPIEREEVRVTRWGLIAVLGAIVCSLAIAV